MNSRNFHSRQIAAAVLVLSLLAGCGKNPSEAPGAAMPSPEVGVVTVTPQPLALAAELPGRLEASRIAEVRARAAGIVLKREFREGSDVRAGDVLYSIDPAPLRAALASAEAALAKAEANLAQARVKAERYGPLVQTHAISKQDYDDAVAARDQAVADVAAAKAARETASLNLGYATVTSPISGRIGRALVTEGALVGQGEATALATVQQIDPIYVNFTQSSAEALGLQRALASGRVQGSRQAEVTLITEDGLEHPHPGKLLFSDLSVDSSTGAVALRAEVPNPERLLLPGMYVRVRLAQAVAAEAITVPQQAVSRGPQGATVMVVGADGKAAVRPVEVGGAHGDAWLIRSGLAAGEQVVVDGLQKAQAGAPVSPVAWRRGETQTAQARPAPSADAGKAASVPQAN